jgi:LysM repeat protein
MGILLVGVVAALFFRNEPLDVDDSLSLRRQQELNQKLKERDIAIYTDERVRTVESNSEELQWNLKDLFESLESRKASVPAPIGVAAIPEKHADTSAERSTNPLRFTPPVDELTPMPGTQNNAAPVDQSKPESSMTAVFENAPKAAADVRQDVEEYTVRLGDTLSGISEKFLGSHHRYREIYEMNKDRIENPDRLRVGSAIRIPRAVH